jgi:hypothetical protein
MNSEIKKDNNITYESFRRNFSNSLERKKSEKYLLQQFQSEEKKRVSSFFSGFESDSDSDIYYNNKNNKYDNNYNFTCPKAPKLL